MLYIGLSYEYAVDGKINDALKTLETGENEPREFIRSLPANMNEAAQHILSATKAHLLLELGNLDAAITVRRKTRVMLPE